jgi:hypothetical protein
MYSMYCYAWLHCELMREFLMLHFRCHITCVAADPCQPRGLWGGPSRQAVTKSALSVDYRTASDLANQGQT